MQTIFRFVIYCTIFLISVYHATKVEVVARGSSTPAKDWADSSTGVYPTTASGTPSTNSTPNSVPPPLDENSTTTTTTEFEDNSTTIDTTILEDNFTSTSLEEITDVTIETTSDFINSTSLEPTTSTDIATDSTTNDDSTTSFDTTETPTPTESTMTTTTDVTTDVTTDSTTSSDTTEISYTEEPTPTMTTDVTTDFTTSFDTTETPTSTESAMTTDVTTEVTTDDDFSTSFDTTETRGQTDDFDGTTFPDSSSYPVTTERSEEDHDCRNLNLKCVGEESLTGKIWTVCAGRVGRDLCTLNGQNADGKALWSCSIRGQFETSQPDYSSCQSELLKDFLKELTGLNDTDHALSFLTRLKERMIEPDSKKANYFSHEIFFLSNVLSEVIELANGFTSFDQFEVLSDVAHKAMVVANILMTTTEPWQHLSPGRRSSVGTNLMKIMEESSLSVTLKFNKYKNSTADYWDGVFEEHLHDDDKFLATSIAYPQSSVMLDGFTYPSSWGTYRDKSTFAKLPQHWQNIIQDPKVECIGMILDSQYVSTMMPGQFENLGQEDSSPSRKVINGKLLSFSVAAGEWRYGRHNNRRSNTSEIIDFKFPGPGIQITFQHDFLVWGTNAVDIPRKLGNNEKPKAALGRFPCLYWDTTKQVWSPEGCKLVSSNETITVCECHHLTAFAVLMDMHNYTGKNLGLEIITWILLPISIVCLALTILLYSTVPVPRQNERSVIIVHLAISLLVGSVLVLLFLDRTYSNEEACVVFGIVTHYTFLTAFGWMGIQGVHLYYMMINVFAYSKSPLLIFRILAYGVPALIVGVTSTGYFLGDKPYGGEVVCWLNGPYMWGFLGPVLLVVLFNSGILFIGIWKSYEVRKNAIGAHRQVKGLRTLVQGSLSLSTLLGLTWLIGYFMLTSAVPGLLAAYAFTILNASQGIFVFSFHCLGNQKMKQGVYQKYGGYLPKYINNWLRTKSNAELTSTTDSTDLKKNGSKDSSRSFTVGKNSPHSGK